MGTNERNAKLGQMLGKGSRDLLLKSWEPLHISRKVGARNSNLPCRFNKSTKERTVNLCQRGAGRGHVTYFWNFGTPSISLEWLEPETSNLVCWLTTRGT